MLVPATGSMLLKSVVSSGAVRDRWLPRGEGIMLVGKDREKVGVRDASSEASYV